MAAAVALQLSCVAGARHTVRADSARYPVSLSPVLLSSEDTPLYLGHQLEPLGSFTLESTRFGLLYGLVKLDSHDISEEINREVSVRGGDGVVSLLLSTRNCPTNWFLPLTILPIWPGCQLTTITGIVVRAVETSSGAGETAKWIRPRLLADAAPLSADQEIAIFPLSFQTNLVTTRECVDLGIAVSEEEAKRKGANGVVFFVEARLGQQRRGKAIRCPEDVLRALRRAIAGAQP